jgi:hypothetical protein
LALLPISSVAAVCALNCRTNGMPSMPMESMSRHGSHNARAAAHHHHEITSDSGPKATAAVSDQFSASHACCSSFLPTLTSPCLRSQNSTQEQTVAPKCNNSSIVQLCVSRLFVFKNTFSRNSISSPADPPAFSHAFSLRI